MRACRLFAGLVRLAMPVWLVLAVSVGRAQSPECRAMWITRFEWPSTNPTVAQANIDSAMANLAASNFNTVYFQVRGQADTLYPSPYEVWSPLIGGSDPGWDPLAYAITSAHNNGIEFHAYINTHTCWQGPSPPSNPDHLFFEHCNAADPSARDWLIHDSGGNPVQYAGSDYVWIAPGVPAFQAYLRQQILYVVENYDVDGIHYDRIRTPGYGYSYDPISMARQSSPQSNPDGLGFQHWTTDQITRNVRDIYAAIVAVKPHVKVSAAVYPYNNAYVHQDPCGWAQTGGLDVIVPMMYWTGGAGSSWDTTLQNWLACSGARHVVPGHHASDGIDSLLEQIALTRLRGGQGNTVFSWSKFGQLWDDYLNNVYPVPVALPSMSWKESPTTGVIHGFVKDEQGGGIADAQIVRTGSAYTGLSSGDGFYSFLLVPPGSYTLTATHPSCPGVILPDLAIAADQVRRVDITLSAVAQPRVTITAEPTEILEAGTVHFVPTVQLPGGDSVTSHTWHFGDGETAPGAGTPTEVDHVYDDLGTHQAYLEIVTAGHGPVTSNEVDIEVIPPPPPPGDFDADGDVDLDDYAHLQICYSGESNEQTDPNCQDAKVDGDTDVDQDDLTIFLGLVSGADVPAGVSQ